MVRQEHLIPLLTNVFTMHHVGGIFGSLADITKLTMIGKQDVVHSYRMVRCNSELVIGGPHITPRANSDWLSGAHTIEKVLEIYPAKRDSTNFFFSCRSRSADRRRVD
jgi:hypothetical protein